MPFECPVCGLLHSISSHGVELGLCSGCYEWFFRYDSEYQIYGGVR